MPDQVGTAGASARLANLNREIVFLEQQLAAKRREADALSMVLPSAHSGTGGRHGTSPDKNLVGSPESPYPQPKQPGLHADEIERYGRQLTLPEIGPEGQARLRAARVLVVGAGGLGCPVAMYLAASGVGSIGVVDADQIELSNLHRQVLHTESGVGTLKAASIARYVGSALIYTISNGVENKGLKGDRLNRFDFGKSPNLLYGCVNKGFI